MNIKLIGFLLLVVLSTVDVSDASWFRKLVKKVSHVAKKVAHVAKKAYHIGKKVYSLYKKHRGTINTILGVASKYDGRIMDDLRMLRQEDEKSFVRFADSFTEASEQKYGPDEATLDEFLDLDEDQYDNLFAEADRREDEDNSPVYEELADELTMRIELI